jgi:hypothetical protein
MICTYTYKGKIFNSEAELDDFLLEKDKYYKEFGDVVFSMTTSQASAKSLLIEADKNSIRAKEKWKAATKEYTEDGVYADIKPYMGVNEFLEGLRNKSNKLYYPEFIDYNYWTKRYLDWAEGHYTEDEAELFGVSTDHGPKLDIHPDLKTFTVDESWDKKTIKEKFEKVTTEEQRKFRAKMEDKWKH